MLWIANLDWESCLTSGPRPALSRRALRAAVRYGRLLQGLAAEGDTIWLPGPPQEEPDADIPGLPQVHLIHGPLPAGWAGPARAWGETGLTAALGTSDPPPALPGLGRPDPQAACRAHGRLFLDRLRETLGCPLPGSGTVRTAEDLVRLCRRTPGPWVLKGNYSGAGRERVLSLGGGEPDSRLLQAARRLLRRHGACLMEPWLERTGDYGCSLLVGEGGATVFAVHRQRVTGAGRLRGIETAAGPVSFSRYLAPGPARRMAGIAAAVGKRLAGDGFRGHAGIDFWTWRDDDGGERVNFLGEINARLTFGLVAAVLARRVGGSRKPGPGAPFCLDLSGGPDPE